MGYLTPEWACPRQAGEVPIFQDTGYTLMDTKGTSSSLVKPSLANPTQTQ